MQATCWYCDVTAWSSPEQFERGMAALPWQARKDRVMRFRFEKDRLLCLGAGLLAAHALKTAGAADLEMAYSESGKPFLARHPKIRFSLSHSGTTAVCAVSETEIGADVEIPRRFQPGVARRCFTAEELAYIEGSDDRDAAFTRMWVRKESCLKMLGTGLLKAPDTVSVLPDVPAPGAGWGFSEYAAGDVRICVCTAVPAETSFVEWKGSGACGSLILTP